MTWTALQQLSDEQVAALRERVGEACARAMAMPEAERRAPRSKGGLSVEQAGAFSAAIFEVATAELERRAAEKK